MVELVSIGNMNRSVQTVCFIFILGLISNIITFAYSRNISIGNSFDIEDVANAIQMDKTLDAFVELHSFDQGLKVLLPEIIHVDVLIDFFFETPKSFFIQFSPFRYDLPPPFSLS